jgi:hypothetical protein
VGLWINWIYWPLKDRTASNYDRLTELHPKYHCNYSTLKICSFFLSCFLVTGFKTVRLHPKRLALILHFQVNWVRVRVALLLAVYCQSAPLGVKPLETPNQHFFQPNACGYSPYVTSSLTRGWVCRLQLLLALASAVTLYCLRFEFPSNLEGQGDPVIPPSIGCPFRPFQVLAGLRWRYPNPPPHGERIIELGLYFVPL